jgi:Holliday junction resolvase-like predicted endonuclease
MPAKDRHHDTVRRALRKDGWQITREQVRITFEDKNLWIDIQAEHPDQERIVLIEVKELEQVSSPVEALACAIGKVLV